MKNKENNMTHINKSPIDDVKAVIKALNSRVMMRTISNACIIINGIVTARND